MEIKKVKRNELRYKLEHAFARMRTLEEDRASEVDKHATRLERIVREADMELAAVAGALGDPEMDKEDLKVRIDLGKGTIKGWTEPKPPDGFDYERRPIEKGGGSES